jgi:hypothetical protein
MKTISIVLCLLTGSTVAAERELAVGSGRPDVSALTLLAKEVAPAAERAPNPSPRTRGLTLSTVPIVTDRTDLIATVSDQQRVLRTVHIDPAPQPPAAAKRTERPLGDPEPKR